MVKPLKLFTVEFTTQIRIKVRVQANSEAEARLAAGCLPLQRVLLPETIGPAVFLSDVVEPENYVVGPAWNVSIDVGGAEGMYDEDARCPEGGLRAPPFTRS